MYRDGLTLGQVRDLALRRVREGYDRVSNLLTATAPGNADDDGLKLLLTGFTMAFVSFSIVYLALGGADASVLFCQFVSMPLTMLAIPVIMYWRAGAGVDRQRGGGNTLSGIIDLVASMPVEEYVPEDSYNECSISQLKKMLDLRRNSTETTSTSDVSQEFVERRELVDAVRQCRKSNDSCIICLEDFNAKDPIRVLPKCGHEFHVECVDQWAYTYASSTNRRNQRPSCPLCKVALK